MIIHLHHNKEEYSCDLSKPLDICIPTGNVRCFYAPPFEAIPFTSGDFIGAVKSGAPVNFFDVKVNPHGNGTHTECLGHITAVQQSINQQLTQFHFIARLISVDLLAQANGDQVITLKELKNNCPEQLPSAIIIRTLPNLIEKYTKDYSGTNPPYLEEAAMAFLVEKGVEHLLIDLPSVDREVDEGKLLGHHTFWNINNVNKEIGERTHCTITELIFVNENIADGLYLLNLQIAPFQLDASPSKPILYRLNRSQYTNNQ